MSESKDKIYYIYIIRCKDNSFYTGLTNNVERRFQEHLYSKGSFYTKYNQPIELVYKEEFYNFKEAQNRERQIKRWTYKKKEALISGNVRLLKRL